MLTPIPTIPVSGDDLNTPGALETRLMATMLTVTLSDVHEYLYSLSSHPGGPLSFRIYDNVISDNLNSVTNPLSVSVHHGFTGITSEDGCTPSKMFPMVTTLLRITSSWLGEHRGTRHSSYS